MPAGAPTKYDEEYIQKVDEYLQQNDDDYQLKTFKATDEKGKDHSKTDIIYRVKLPTIEGFASFIGVSKKSLYNWRDEHEEFLHALEKIEREQHRRLVNEGLAGNYNPTIAKLILSSNHGMSEKQAIDHNHGGKIDFDIGKVLKKAYGDKEDGSGEAA